MAAAHSPAELLADPWIAAQVDAAVARFEGRLLPEELAWMREQLAESLANDEHAAAVLGRAHPRVGDRSGEQVKGAVGPAKERPAPRRGTKR